MKRPQSYWFVGQQTALSIGTNPVYGMQSVDRFCCTSLRNASVVPVNGDCCEHALTIDELMNSFPVVLNKLHWTRNLRFSRLPVIDICIIVHQRANT